MKRSLPAGLFLGGLVLGTIAGGLWLWHVFSRLNVAKEVDAYPAAAPRHVFRYDINIGSGLGGKNAVRPSECSGWDRGGPVQAVLASAGTEFYTNSAGTVSIQ